MAEQKRGEHTSSTRFDLKFLLAVILACVVGLGCGYLEGHQAERYKNSSRDYGQDAERKAVLACRDGSPTAVASCIYREIDSSQIAAQTKQNLSAQLWMVRWSGLLTLTTLCTLFVSWVALRYLKNTFAETAKGVKAAADGASSAADATNEMIKQNKIAGDNLAFAREGRRPWIGVDHIEVVPLRENDLTSFLKVVVY